MAAEGDQTASRRRMGRMGGYDRDSPVYRDISRSERTSPHTTDNYRFDEGMFDVRRPSSSVVRMSTGNIPRQTGTQPSPVPARRQSTGNTRDMAPPPARQITGSAGSTGNTKDITSSHARQNQQSRQTQQSQTRNPRLSVPQTQSPYAGPPTRTTRTSTNRTSPTATRMGTRPAPIPVRVKEKPARKVHWLLPAGVGMIVMLLLWVIGSDALAWGTQVHNDFTYGNPRTYQTDAVVGHNDSAAHPSHFIAVNLDHQAVIFELKGGNPADSESYKAAFYRTDTNDKLDPVTLEFKDVNGDGKLDMIVHVHSSTQDQIIVFLNDGKQFVGVKSSDNINYSKIGN